MKMNMYVLRSGCRRMYSAAKAVTIENYNANLFLANANKSAKSQFTERERTQDVKDTIL